MNTTRTSPRDPGAWMGIARVPRERPPATAVGRSPGRFATLRSISTLACICIIALLAQPAGAGPSDVAPPPLETVQRRAFDFFWNETNPETGLTKDREKNSDGPEAGKSTVASIASTGYMLAALPVGVEHRWILKRKAYDRALTTLRYVHDALPNVHGFYFHFLDWSTGARVWNSELSSIDTTLLAIGGLTAGEYWRGTPVQRLANDIVARMDWQWMRTDGSAKPDESAPSMGWNPEKGFIPARWQGYTEAAYLYLLALGTPSPNGLSASSWDALRFDTVKEEDVLVFGGPSPIFWAQMTPGYFDLRGLRDRQGRDWWSAWKNAHLADQAYCARRPGSRTYAAGFWAINASDQPQGYGAGIPEEGKDTGTVSPTGMLAGIVFTKERSENSLIDLWSLHDKIWGRYGFCNAFNIDKNWYDPDVIGIDLGMMLLMTENARSGLIWRLVKHTSIARRGMEAAGFHAIAMDH